MCKRKSWFILIIALANLSNLLLASAAQLDKDGVAQCPPQMTMENCQYYREGFSDGQADRQVGMYNLQSGSEKSFDRPIEPAYRSGYQDGYKPLKQTKISK